MQKTGKIMVCECCGKEVYIPPNRWKKFRFCSLRCHGKTILSNPAIQARIKHPIGEKNWRWKKEGCKRKDGYVLVTINRKRKYLHRHVMEQHLGRELQGEENVHHINHNRSDNRIENLKLYKTKAEHTLDEKHFPSKKYDPNEFKICKGCDKKFFRWQKDKGTKYGFNGAQYCIRKCYLLHINRNPHGYIIPA